MVEILWDSANKLRGTVESAEYKHVVLGLIFLKFASNKFEERRKELIAEGKEITPTCRNYLGSRKEFETDKDVIKAYCDYAIKFFETV
jgi:type I restriction-modification system DNA methylase subunit